MAKRSRQHRQEIPGYHEIRPNRRERRQQHRQVRHNTNQLLHMADDPEEIAGLPEVRGSREHDEKMGKLDPQPRRFRVWKTKFWKRRGKYHHMKTRIDSNWPVITSEQLRREQT